MWTIDVLMSRAIDYAGMFPPANLPLAEALCKWNEYQLHPNAGFLGSFVLRAALVAGLEHAPARVSVLVRAQEITRRSHVHLKAESVEIDLPPEAYSNGHHALCDFLDTAGSAFPNAGRIFIELDWRKNYAPLMSAICERRSSFGVKLRTGGLTPESIPPSADVARFLLAAAAHELPLKATAGLHVPVPNVNPGVGARMHGFLNFFCAGFLAFSGRGSGDSIARVLEEFTYEHFSFGEDSMRCGATVFLKDEVERLRARYILSFGSCSFLEPVEHLAAHGLI
jgi:hypothetical protein